MSRYITPDTIVPDPYNPQSLNRYSYCLNNPLIYTDPSGHEQITYDEWQAYMAILAQAYSLYEVWPQMGGIMLHDFLMGFNSFQTGFEVRAVDPETMILTQLLAGVQSSGNGGGRSAAAQAATQTTTTTSSSNTQATDAERFYATVMINIAIAYYGIDVSGTKITYNPDMEGARALCWKNGRIEIGQSAFKYGFSLLGSIIAHEAEVHFQLQAKKGIWYPAADTQGRAYMEFQAYQYQLDNAQRFGLTSRDIADITSLRNKYAIQLSQPDLLKFTLTGKL